MEVIRRAAANAAIYKLDLRDVFHRFDVSGDGYISKPEMAEAFLHMGVQLDLDTVDVLFR
jgi:Ca2+-binding EF-hand superfamily protein